jgi:hypothetical protein
MTFGKNITIRHYVSFKNSFTIEMLRIPVLLQLSLL